MHKDDKLRGQSPVVDFEFEDCSRRQSELLEKGFRNRV